jgi:hypothetical protein
MNTKCLTDGCKDFNHARGYCKVHYAKMLRQGVITRVRFKKIGTCTIDGCDKPQSAKLRCEKHYREYKVSMNPRIYKDVEVRRQERARERKEMFIAEMGGKCKICGYDKNPACFDFHHIDPSIKDHEPRHILKNPNLKKIRDELSKCILLCKNCHADLHHPVKQAGVIVGRGGDPDIPDDNLEQEAP